MILVPYLYTLLSLLFNITVFWLDSAFHALFQVEIQQINYCIDVLIESFSLFFYQINTIPTILGELENKETKEDSKPLSKNWNESLTSFQKLIAIKVFEEEKV